MSSHDYRWLGSSIKQAIRDDHDRSRRSGAEERSWKQIEEENRKTQKQHQLASQKPVYAHTLAAQAKLAPITDYDAADVATSFGIHLQSPTPLSPTATSSIGATTASTTHPERMDQIDPSSAFPPDKSRPFTGVRLVAFRPQQDWSNIRKRAAKIADTRKKQLGHAYQIETAPGQSSTEAKAAAKRQNKLDRKRMKIINKKARADEKLKLQRDSTMVLTSSSSSSESSSESSDDDEIFSNGGVLANYKGKGKKKQTEVDSDESDGPPPDEEEIRMRMERAAWKKTREMIGRTLQRLSMNQKGPAAKNSIPISNFLTPGASMSYSMQQAGVGAHSRQRGSIMMSNDRRVQGLYDHATSELEKKNSAETKEKEAMDRFIATKEADAEKKKRRIERIKEQRRTLKSSASESSLHPSAASKKLTDDEAAFNRDAGFDAGMRVLDRSKGERDAELINALSPAHSKRKFSNSPSPSRRPSGLSRPHSSASLYSIGDNSERSEMPNSLLQSESTPSLHNLSIGGHVIRPKSPPKMKKQPAHLDIAPMSPMSPSPSTPLHSIPDEPFSSTTSPPLIPPPGLGGMNAFNSPLLARRRGPVLPPATAPAALINNRAVDSPSLSSSPSTTFLTESPLASSPGISMLPTLPTRQHLRGAPQKITNVLSPIEASTPTDTTSHQSEGELYSLKDSRRIVEDYKPTLLQPISSIVRSFTGNPLDQISTALVARPGAETTQVMRKLQANLAAADEEIHHMLTAEQKEKRKIVELALLNDDPFSFMRAQANNANDTPRLAYSRKRSEKAELTSKIMMSFTHKDMENISDEIVRNGGEMTKEDFIRITRRKKRYDRDYRAETEALSDIFNEIDVNSDNSLSFLEFTSYLVELAHTQYEDTDAHQIDNVAFSSYQTLEDQPLMHNEDDIEYTSVKWIEPLESFVALEKDQVRFKILGKNLRCSRIVRGHTAPVLDVEYLPFHQLLVSSSLDKTMKFWSCNWDKDGKQQQMAALMSLGDMNSGAGGKGSLSFPGEGESNEVVNLNLLKSTYSHNHSSIRSSPLQPTYTEIASWHTPLPQYCLTWNKTRLYSSDATGRIIVWNVDTGDTRASLLGHDAKVNVMLSGLTDRLVSGSDDTTVRLWDTGRNVEVACLRKHERSVRSLCYSAPMNMLVSAGDDEYLRIWDIASNKHVSSFYFENSWFKTLPGHDQDSVVSMEILDNELLVGSKRGMFRLYDLRMMVPLQTFSVPDVDEESVAAAAAEAAEEAAKPKKRKMLTGASEGVLDGHGDPHDEVETEMQRMRRRGKIAMRSFCIFHDQALLEEHAQKVKEIQREREEERARAIENALASGENASAIIDSLPETFDIPRDPKCQLIIAASGRHLHRFGKGGSVTRNISHDEPIIHAEFNANSLTIFTVSAKQVKIWCCITGRLIREYNDILMKENHAATIGTGAILNITSACLDQRKRKFILGDNLGNIYVFNYNNGGLMHMLSNTAPSKPALTTSASNQQHLTLGRAASGSMSELTSPVNAKGLVHHPAGTNPAQNTGTDILNLHCLLNVSYSAGVATPNISINFVHSISSGIVIHVDDPDHMPANHSGIGSTSSSANGGSDGGNHNTIVKRKKDEGDSAGGAPRTVLHSLNAHKQDISCIAISQKFGVIASASADCSVVFYPSELAGSPIQRIIPAEALHGIASGFSATPLLVEAFKTPILSVVFLHPYKILACTDNLGHIFFYYFTRDKHQLIGMIRNSKRWDTLSAPSASQRTDAEVPAGDAQQGLAVPPASAAKANPDDAPGKESIVGKRASQQAIRRASLRMSARNSSQQGALQSLTAAAPSNSQLEAEQTTVHGVSKSHRPSVSGGSSGSGGSDEDELTRQRRSGHIDFPPVLSLLFDAKTNVLYTSDDMGYVKGWKLENILLAPHREEYRKRRWNEFSNMAPSAQRPPRIIHSLGSGFAHHSAFKNDDHQLLNADEILHVFHMKDASRNGLSASHAALEASTRTFRIRPFFAVQAHNGACNGVQLVSGEEGLVSKAEQEKRDREAEEKAVQQEAQILAQQNEQAASAKSSPAVKTRGITAQQLMERTAAAAAANGGHTKNVSSVSSAIIQNPSQMRRVSLGSLDNTSAVGSAVASVAGSTVATPRSEGSVSVEHSRNTSSTVQPSSNAHARSVSNNEEKESSNGNPVPQLSKKELEALSEAKIRRWENQAWDDDSSDDEVGKINHAHTRNNSTFVDPNARQTYSNVRDIPDRPRGIGRRTSMASELTGTNLALIATAPEAKPASEGAAPTMAGPAQRSKGVSPTPDSATGNSPSKIPKGHSSGNCLLTWGTDGCVHLFSLHSHKRIATLQQGFTIRNCKTTPPEWRFYYQIPARSHKDEEELDEVIAGVEAEEARIFEEARRAHEEELRLIELRKLEAEEDARRRYEEEVDRLGGHYDRNGLRTNFDPFRNVMKNNPRSSLTGSNNNRASQTTPKKVLQITEGERTPSRGSTPATKSGSPSKAASRASTRRGSLTGPLSSRNNVVISLAEEAEQAALKAGVTLPVDAYQLNNRRGTNHSNYSDDAPPEKKKSMTIDTEENVDPEEERETEAREQRRISRSFQALERSMKKAMKRGSLPEVEAAADASNPTSPARTNSKKKNATSSSGKRSSKKKASGSNKNSPVKAAVSAKRKLGGSSSAVNLLASSPADKMSQEALSVQRTQHAIITSKSMSALTPSLYANAGGAALDAYNLSTNTMSTNLHAVSGVTAVVPSGQAPPSQKFTNTDFTGTWTDYDGTVRTIDDPLAYRFNVENFLASVALKHDRHGKVDPLATRKLVKQLENTTDSMDDREETKDSDAIDASLSQSFDQSLTFTPSTPMSPVAAAAAAAAAGESRRPSRIGALSEVSSPKAGSSHRPSISIRTVPTAASLAATDSTMAFAQAKALERQNRMKKEEEERARNTRERSEMMMEASIAREHEIRAQKAEESKKPKLSSVEAAVHRMRMLTSRKPLKMLEAESEALTQQLAAHRKK